MQGAHVDDIPGARVHVNPRHFDIALHKLHIRRYTTDPHHQSHDFTGTVQNLQFRLNQIQVDTDRITGGVQSEPRISQRPSHTVVMGKMKERRSILGHIDHPDTGAGPKVHNPGFIGVQRRGEIAIRAHKHKELMLNIHFVHLGLYPRQSALGKVDLARSTLGGASYLVDREHVLAPAKGAVVPTILTIHLTIHAGRRRKGLHGLLHRL